MILYNVNGTGNDNPNISDSWLDAHKKPLANLFYMMAMLMDIWVHLLNKYGSSNAEYILLTYLKKKIIMILLNLFM